MRKQNAFTLVELLVVIAIIALLMAILMPALRRAREVARMVACGSNQKQVILGLLTYSHDNDYKLPPNPGRDGNVWHRPNDLNFCSNYWGQKTPLTDAQMNSVKDSYHYAGKYLGTILKNSEVFNCPVSKIRDNAIWPPYGTAAGAYGEFYRTGRYATLPCTYSMFYSFDGFNNASAGAKPFDAPNRTSDKNTLVIQDTLMYLKGNPELAWLPDPAQGQYSFHTCHSFRKAFHAKPYFTLNRPGYNLNGPLPQEMNGLMLNAGYLDGHVEKFNANDTVHLTHNGIAHNWLTQNYK
jgi:prepilin-type N-terminal cleavage/methylation domain-containing protein/prepilin-type processing-associated H-X9-DG protein